MRRRKLAILFTPVWPALCSGQAQYTWIAFDLHTPGAHHSEALGVSRVGIAGNPSWTGRPEISGASLWFSRPEPWTLLREPDRQLVPVVESAGEFAQCGADQPEWTRAALWFGSRESLLDLDPGPPYAGSRALDVRGDMAVGYAGYSGKNHAIVWIAHSPFLFIDLHPRGVQHSFAKGTDGFWQGGSAGLDGVIWKGTAESMVVMDPPGYDPCSINGMAIGTQVGAGLTRTGDGLLRDHALLWHDTPESWIDMNPSFHADRNSYLWGTTGQIHSGQSDGRAGVWFGDDPDSFFGLHDFIPGDPSGGSRAIDIDIYGGTVYIAGRANFDGRTHAIVWVGTPVGIRDAEESPAPRGAGAGEGENNARRRAR